MGVAIVSVCDTPHALVIEEQTGELSLANLETGEVTLVASGLSSPFAMVMEPEAATVLVTESDRLSRVNLATNTIAAVTLFANRPTGLAIDPAQPDTVWVVEHGTGDLFRIRRSDGSRQDVIHQLGLARARGLAFEKAGVLLVAEGDAANGGIIRVDLNRNPPTFATIASGEAGLRLPFGLDLGGGGDVAYVTAQAANHLARVDGLTSGAGALRPYISPLKGPTGIARLTDGRVVVAQHATNDLVVLDPAACTLPPCQPPAPAVAGLGVPGDLVIEGPDTALVLERNDTPNGGALSRVNTRTGTVTEMASGLTAPEALVLAGRTVYVAEAGAIGNTSSGKIRKITLAGGAATDLSTGTLFAPSGMALVDPSTLIVIERTGALVRVNLSNDTMIRPSLPTAMGIPVGIAIAQAADGMHAYITDTSLGTLLKVRDVASCNPCSTETVATNLPNPSGIAVEASGVSALVITDTRQPSGGAIVRVFLQGAAIPVPSTIVKGLSHPQRIVIEPSGTTALVTETDPDGVTRVTLPPP
jgi:sugar lactone lactonase YvrE